MKNFFKLAPVALGLLTLASCNSDDLLGNFGEKQLDLTAGEGEMIATMEDGTTRTGVSDNAALWVWTEGDAYMAYDENIVNRKRYQLDATYSGSATGKFAADGGQDLAANRFGVYPYNKDNKIVLEDAEEGGNVVSKSILYMQMNKGVPASVNGGTDNAYALDYTDVANGDNGDLGEAHASIVNLPQWGYVTSETNRAIKFAKMTAVIRLNMKGIPASVGNGYLLIESKDDKYPLAGDFKCDITDFVANYELGDAPTNLPVLEKNAEGTTKQIVKFNFATGGVDLSKKVFYLAVPAGLAEEKLEISLYKEDNTLVTLGTVVPAASNDLDNGKFKRGNCYSYVYTVEETISATSLKEVNAAINKYLSVAGNNDGRSVVFNIEGESNVAVGVSLTGKDNMLLIPDTKDNITLNFNDGIDMKKDGSSVDFFIAEAAYGTSATDNANQWLSAATTETRTGQKTNVKELNDAITAVSTNKRTITINTTSLGTEEKTIYVYAPNSSVTLNNVGTSHVRTASVRAVTASDGALSMGVEGANSFWVKTVAEQWTGSFKLGAKAGAEAVKTDGSGNVDVIGNIGGIDGNTPSGTSLLTNNSTGAVTIDKASTVYKVYNNKGAITVDGTITKDLDNTRDAGNIIVNGKVSETLKNSSTNGTIVVNKGAIVGTLTTTSGATGTVDVKAATITTINRNGTGNLTITGDLTKDETTQWSIGATVTDEQANACNAKVGTINNKADGEISVSNNSVALTIDNDVETTQISVDGEIYVKDTANKLAKSAGTTNISISDEASFSTKSAGNIAVSNSKGVVAIVNYGGTTTLTKVVNTDNTLTHNSRSTSSDVTLTDSYVGTLTYDPNIACHLIANGSSGIGVDNAATNALTITDNTGSSYNYVCEYNIDGNIYTAAQLTALTKSATTATTVKLLFNLPYTDTNAAWAGIKQGAITTFDGNNKTISGLNLKEQDKAGLFGEISGHAIEIKNLFLDHVTYAASTVSNPGFQGEKAGHEGVAALIGYASKAVTLNYVEVNNSSIANGNTTASSGTAALIGLAGGNANFTFNYCEVKNTSVSGHYYIGGMIGILKTAGAVTFKECVAKPSLSVGGDAATVAASNNFEATKSGTVGKYIGGATTTVTTLTIDANSESDALTGKAELGYNKNNKIIDGKTYYFIGGRDEIGFVAGTISTFTIGGTAQIAYPTNNNTYNKYSTTANN